MMMTTIRTLLKGKTLPQKLLSIALSISLLSGLLLENHLAMATSTTLSISQIPLKLATPILPQVLIAIGNSQSMDGTLSGAIMVGSGTKTGGLSSLQNSDSPINYTVPAGFTPPAQPADVSGQAPYSVTTGGRLVDNSASRLNVAKAGVQAIIEAYIQNTDFALETYNISGGGLRSTWVYYMSPPGGAFQFTNTPIAGNRYTTNPCFNYSTASSTVKSNCGEIDSVYGGASIANSLYMQIGSSSDDPDINDVLYSSGSLKGVFVSYNGPTPASPYPPNFSLSNYNNGSVSIRYGTTKPSIGSLTISPTNAGYVPYSTQVMSVGRGFAYSGSSQSANQGNVVIPMTSLGANPTTTQLATAINQFTPYLQPETNSTSSTEIKSAASQAPIAGLLTTAKTYLTGLPTTACGPNRYVILISDGLPTQDLSGKFWPPLGSAAASGYGVTASFNADGSLNTTNNTALTDTITTLTNLNNAGIKTFIIGLGAGVDPTVNPQAAATLSAMAVAGGTVDYYPATSPVDLVNNLNNILIAVQNGSFSTTAAAVSSTRLQVGTVEYQASFTSSDQLYQDWTGEVIEKSLDPSTGFPVGSDIWSAKSQLDAQSSRVIATWNPTLNNGAGGGAPFQWASLSATQQLQLQPSDALGSSRLNYLRGNQSLEKHNGGTFRNRTHLLGDIVNSTPLYVGPPINSALFPYSNYSAFVLAKSNRPGMLYVGANDGMLHALKTSSGSEQFAFIPNAVFSNLYNLTAPLYNQNHRFFVDGPPQSGDVQFSDGSWHTILVGGEGAGGNSIYSLDITDPGSLNSEAALAQATLWEFTDGDLGLTYGQPQIGQISASSPTSLKFAVFFGNGYNSPNNTAALFAVSPESGQLIRKIDLCAAVPGACDPTQPQGLSPVALAQDNGLQGQPISQVYAGDLQGNLWAIDVANPNSALWSARLLFKARSPDASSQPITTPPQVTLNPSYPRFQGNFVMFGTGQLLTTNDLTSTQTQSVYGVWDKPYLSTVLDRLSLQIQTLNIVTTGTSGLIQDILTATTNAVGWNSKYGWYTDLPIPGQRIITNPQLLNGSFITTLNTPPATSCDVASSWFLNLYYQTGGAYPNVQLDINGDNLINADDQYNEMNPVGFILAPGYASSPTSVGINQNNQRVQLITLSNGQQVSVINRNNSTRQTGWWQIQ